MAEPVLASSPLETLIRRWFTADVRSLAAMRIGAAAVVLFDLWDRSQHLRAHYTDEGVLPRAILLAEADHWSRTLSLHLLGGSFAFQCGMFALTAVAATMLLLGWRTRLATIATYVLLVSLHARNPWVVFGGDFALKMVIFWGIFLPWGAVFSLDRRRGRARGEPDPPLEVCSTGVAAAMIQIAIVYFFTAILKTGAPWRSEFTAIYWALSLEDHVGLLGPWIYGHPALMKALTAGSILVEFAAPFLLFLPFWTRAGRIAALIGVTGLHLGILTTMRVGFFPVISIVALLVFVPGSVWGTPREAHRAPAAPPRRGALADLAMLAPVVLIGYVFAWNVGFPAPLGVPGTVLGIHQGWDMFAPEPRTDDGFWVLVGTLSDGRQVDLMRGGAPIVWERTMALRGERVRKFYSRLQEKRGGKELRGFTAHLCRSWKPEQLGGASLVRVEPLFVRERNLPDYGRGSQVRIALDPLDCPAAPADADARAGAAR
jgi:hypothetical protein